MNHVYPSIRSIRRSVTSKEFINTANFQFSANGRRKISVFVHDPLYSHEGDLISKVNSSLTGDLTALPCRKKSNFSARAGCRITAQNRIKADFAIKV